MVAGHALSIADVRTSLQTGLIDTVAISPVAAIVLQWHTQVKYLTPSLQLLVKCVVSLFAGAICALAGYFSLGFVISEYHAAEIAFANVPAWLCESILPVAFTIMALRFGIQCGIGFAQMRKAGLQ